MIIALRAALILFLLITNAYRVYSQECKLLVAKSSLRAAVMDQSQCIWYLDAAGRLYKHNSILEHTIEGIPKMQQLLHANGDLIVHDGQEIFQIIGDDIESIVKFSQAPIQAIFARNAQDIIILGNHKLYHYYKGNLDQCSQQINSNQFNSHLPTKAYPFLDQWYLLSGGKVSRICGSQPRSIVSTEVFLDLESYQGELYLLSENEGPFIVEGQSVRPLTSHHTAFPYAQYLRVADQGLLLFDPYSLQVVKHNDTIVHQLRTSEELEPVQLIDNSILALNTSGVSLCKFDTQADVAMTQLVRLNIGEASLLEKSTFLLDEPKVLEAELTSTYWGDGEKPKYFYRAPPKYDTWQPWDIIQPLSLQIDQDIKSFELQKIHKAKAEKLLSKTITFQHSTKSTHLPWLIILGLLSLLGIVLFTSVRRYRKAQESHREKIAAITLQKQYTEEQLKSLQLQMNPHFIFNVLNSIQGLIALGDNQKARQSLNSFSQLLRTMLNQSSEMVTSLKDELSLLEKYLQLEQLCRPDKFTHSIDTHQSLDLHHTIPSMIIQPFLENAIVHGIRWKESKGQITLNIVPDEAGVKCIIEDDGVGRVFAERQAKSAHKSIGLSIVEKRLKKYFRFNKTIDPILFEDLYDTDGRAKGTRVTVIIPIL